MLQSSSQSTITLQTPHRAKRPNSMLLVLHSNLTGNATQTINKFRCQNENALVQNTNHIDKCDSIKPNRAFETPKLMKIFNFVQKQHFCQVKLLKILFKNINIYMYNVETNRELPYCHRVTFYCKMSYEKRSLKIVVLQTIKTERWRTQAERGVAGAEVEAGRTEAGGVKRAVVSRQRHAQVWALLLVARARACQANNSSTSVNQSLAWMYAPVSVMPGSWTSQCAAVTCTCTVMSVCVCVYTCTW